jgi:hypothetical protein
MIELTILAFALGVLATLVFQKALWAYRLWTFHRAFDRAMTEYEEADS